MQWPVVLLPDLGLPTGQGHQGDQQGIGAHILQHQPGPQVNPVEETSRPQGLGPHQGPRPPSNGPNSHQPHQHRKKLGSNSRRAQQAGSPGGTPKNQRRFVRVALGLVQRTVLLEGHPRRTHVHLLTHGRVLGRVDFHEIHPQARHDSHQRQGSQEPSSQGPRVLV